MKIETVNIEEIINHSIQNIFRTNTSKPGYVLFDFGTQISSSAFRAVMIGLKNGLATFIQERYNKQLDYQWLGRFDQQVNTPYHLDNASEQSILMLGYEPSEIESELFLADYDSYYHSNAKGIEKEGALYEPIIQESDADILPFRVKLDPFDNKHFKLVVINNSNSKSNREMLGLYHKATILEPDLNKSRVVNSMMLNFIPMNDKLKNVIDEEHFINTTLVSK